MPKGAAFLFAARRAVDAPPLATQPVPPGTVCYLCADPLTQSYPVPNWDSVSDWTAFNGAGVPGVRALCAPCALLVIACQKTQSIDPVTNKRENHYGPDAVNQGGWQRIIQGEANVEHFAQIKPLKADNTAYWQRLTQAIFEPRAHSWMIILRGPLINFYPYLPYTPAHSPYLNILTNHAGGLYVAHIRRTTLWDAIQRVTALAPGHHDPVFDALDPATQRLATILKPQAPEDPASSPPSMDSHSKEVSL